jgi:hypothetical protein
MVETADAVAAIVLPDWPLTDLAYRATAGEC